LPDATVKFPLTVVVPDAAPREIAVAAPPMLRVVAVVLKRFAVVFAAIRSEELAPPIVTPAEAVTAPVRVEVPLTTREPLAEALPY